MRPWFVVDKSVHMLHPLPRRWRTILVSHPWSRFSSPLRSTGLKIRSLLDAATDWDYRSSRETGEGGRNSTIYNSNMKLVGILAFAGALVQGVLAQQEFLAKLPVCAVSPLH